MGKLFLSTWALLCGVFLLMVGNGIQGTLLGVRGEIEGFSTNQMSYVMAAYFIGFLGGSRTAPWMIRRVGHVRVFAALGSMISAVLILYPVFPNPWAWSVERILIGFCFSGVYVTAESWLNNAVDNSNRGRALSLYVVVQMAGIVTAQGVMAAGDAAGFIVFIVPSILVSLAFAPILLSVQPTPAFETTKPLPLRQLIEASPLTSVGMLLLGTIYSVQFTMSAVYGSMAGMSIAQISTFVSVMYVGALVAQFPIGWLSDKMDRRLLVVMLSAMAGFGACIGLMDPANYTMALIGAGCVGAMSNPIYALILAYANDYLDHEDMPAASAGYVFIHGIGAIIGPVLVGGVMTVWGPAGFWLHMAVLLFGLAAYAAYRMTQRAAYDGDVVPYAPVSPAGSLMAVEFAQEEYIAREIEIEEEGSAEE